MSEQENMILHYSQTPVWVDELTDISDFQARLMGYINTFENITGVAFPSNGRIAKKFHKKVGSVQNALSDLYKKGYVTSTLVYKEDSQEIDKRYLKLIRPSKVVETPPLNNGNPTIKKLQPYNLEVKDNILINKSINKRTLSPAEPNTPPPNITIAKKALEYFNKTSDSKFNSNASKNTKPIIARLNEGFTPNDLKTVIDLAAKNWGGKEKYRKWYRPETLFNGRFDDRLTGHYKWQFLDDRHGIIQKETLINYNGIHQNENSEASAQIKESRKDWEEYFK